MSQHVPSRTPTPEQKSVIEASENSFTVVASAGAGKTFVLVERYLRHVADEGMTPDQILTITFTKKAAAEMKERIVRRLRDLGRFDEAQIAETGPIQTIHSFCERLLRENALEAGLDPKYEILAEDQAARMVTACIREAMASDLDDAPEAEGLIRYLAGKRLGYGENQSPYVRLESSVETVLSELRSSRYDRDVISLWYQNVTTLKAAWEQTIKEQLPESCWETFDTVEFVDWNDRVQKACKQKGVSVPAWAKGKGDLEAEEDSLRFTCGLVQLACEAWWRLDRDMHERQALDFTALEIKANRLLEKSEVTRQRVRDQYQVVMVDESQDVNPIQYKLLDNLGCPRTMMVGDAQQSIYGFRQADVRLFKRRVLDTHTKKLTKNWRSDPGILNFVDLVFSRMWSSEYSPMQLKTGPMDFDDDGVPNYDGVELWRQPAKNPAATAGYILELKGEGVEYRDIAILVRAGQAAIAMKKALDNQGIPSRIAGGSEKFYTRLEVRDLANTLRSVADPYDDFALLATLRSPMVGLSLDAIALLGLHPFIFDQLEAFESPVEADRAKLAAFLAWFVPLSKMADRLSAWEVLAEIYAQSDYLPALARRSKGEQMLANARKLLTLATEEPELGPKEYSERIREIQNLRHKEGDAPADENDADLVKIMTVHKAKGLEWPVVILAQTDRPIVPKMRDLVVDPSLGIAATKFSKGQSLMHKLLTHRKKAGDEEEERRILYVALTRAQNRLCVVLVPPGNSATVSKLVEGLIDPGQMPGIKVRSRFEPQAPKV